MQDEKPFRPRSEIGEKFRNMAVGDTFKAPRSRQSHMGGWARLYGIRVSTRKLDRYTITVTRTQ